VDSITTSFVDVGAREWFSLRGPGGPVRFVRIPAGTFDMGCELTEQGSKPYETPRHQVTISHDFAFCVSEVTRGAYEMFVSDTGHVPLPNIDDWSPDASDPVVGLTWYESEEYLAWLADRLGLDSAAVGSEMIARVRMPTEAEWEYACRAKTSTAFSFGSDRSLLGTYGWFQDNSGLRTHGGLTLRPNQFGLHNMHGNTWEWCSDWYGPYSQEGSIDPVGASETDWRVLRGGCWNLNERYSRSACRNWHIPTNRNWYIGLRVALSLHAAEGSS
jgi:formylglycine-generating enzyme required for sulfatase activity